jgi:NADH:ubiquinone oxidoreductase subunit B-like Fe-S oxidoreductase
MRIEITMRRIYDKQNESKYILALAKACASSRGKTGRAA